MKKDKCEGCKKTDACDIFQTLKSLRGTYSGIKRKIIITVEKCHHRNRK